MEIKKLWPLGEGVWPAPTGQQLILESNSETQPVGDVMHVMDGVSGPGATEDGLG